jgi:hypothetical protein
VESSNNHLITQGSQPSMHPNPRLRAQQQNRVRRRANDSDAYAFFNLLTDPELLDKVESLLPEHRERLFPPTEALSMFLSQALSMDRSCQRAVNETAVKRAIGISISLSNKR